MEGAFSEGIALLRRRAEISMGAFAAWGQVGHHRNWIHVSVRGVLHMLCLRILTRSHVVYGNFVTQTLVAQSRGFKSTPMELEYDLIKHDGGGIQPRETHFLLQRAGLNSPRVRAGLLVSDTEAW